MSEQARVGWKTWREMKRFVHQGRREMTDSDEKEQRDVLSPSMLGW